VDRLEKEYELRAFQPGDEEEIVKLLVLAFDGWPKFDLLSSPIEYWRWKFQNEARGMNRIVVGLNNDEVIGCTHTLPLRVKIGNKVYPSVQGVDVAVHPNLRKKAIFNKITDLAAKMRKASGVQFHYFSTKNPIVFKYYPKNLFHRFPHSVTRLFRIHDVRLQLRKQPMKYSFIYRYAFHLSKFANRCRNTFQLHRPSSNDFHIRKIAHFDERIEGFWEEIKDHYSFMIERSRDYLNWRYCDPRGGDYLVKIAEANNQILAYTVLRIDKNQRDYPVGYIVDLLILPNRFDVANALVSDAANYFDDHHINIVICLIIKNHPYEAILKKNGFIADLKKRILYYRIYGEIKELTNLKKEPPSRIHFVYGDFDDI